MKALFVLQAYEAERYIRSCRKQLWAMASLSKALKRKFNLVRACQIVQDTLNSKVLFEGKDRTWLRRDLTAENMQDFLEDVYPKEMLEVIRNTPKSINASSEVYDSIFRFTVGSNVMVRRSR